MPVVVRLSAPLKHPAEQAKAEYEAAKEFYARAQTLYLKGKISKSQLKAALWRREESFERFWNTRR